MIKNWIFVTIMCFTSGALAQDIEILGLFKDKVVIEIEGQTKVLKLGEEVNGIKLISANSQQCVLQINGKLQTFNLSTELSVNFAPSTAPVVKIPQDDHGMYRTSGTINGQRVDFLVDTGASIVALNNTQAINLGINYHGGTRTQVETASGKAIGFEINLDEISVGNIKVYNIPAVVVEGSMPSAVLLGRTFLTRVEMKEENQLLELRQKY